MKMIGIILSLSLSVFFSMYIVYNEYQHNQEMNQLNQLYQQIMIDRNFVERLYHESS